MNHHTIGETKIEVENIPPELKALPQWLCWKLEERDGKPTKIPYNPRIGSKAQSVNPATWGSFEEAVKAVSRLKCSGVGFVFTDADPYVGVDLDKCFDPETGSIEPWAKKWIDHFKSYTEITPSGKGFHIIVKGALPPGGNRRGPLEVYSRGRYFTVTGDIFDGSSRRIEERSRELDAFHGEVFTKPSLPPVGAGGGRGCNLSRPDDEELLEIARNATNGAKFSQLWAGNWTGAGYPSQSEADQALCNSLAFYTGNDAERIDRLFRRSGLHRPKWDRTDYSESTIQRAISTTDVTYSPRGASLPVVGKRTQADASTEEEPDYEIKVWPTLPPAALRGIAGEVVELATRSSEADPAAVLATFLCRTSIELGRDAYFMVGDSRHSARLNAIIVGNSSKARKGTSAKPITRIFRFDSQHVTLDSPNLYLPARQTPGPLSSGEGLIYAVRDAVKIWQVDKKTKGGEWVTVDPGVDDKRLFVLDEELAAALKCTKREGNTLSVVVRSAFDDGNFSPLTKTNRIEAHGAHIGIVSHITLAELNYLLDETEALNGFANRFLWVCSRRQKLVPLPEPMPEKELKSIQRDLLGIFRAAQGIGRVSMHPSTRDYWTSIYSDLSTEQPGLVGCVVNRGEAMVLRLALTYCLLSGHRTIDINHMEAALAFWDYARESAEYIFSGRQSNPIAQKILDAVERGPASFTDIHKLLSNHAAKREIQAALQELASSGKIKIEDVTTGGRPKKIISLAKEAKKAKKGCGSNPHDINSLFSHNSPSELKNEDEGLEIEEGTI